VWVGCALQLGHRWPRTLPPGRTYFTYHACKQAKLSSLSLVPHSTPFSLPPTPTQVRMGVTYWVAREPSLTRALRFASPPQSTNLRLALDPIRRPPLRESLPGGMAGLMRLPKRALLSLRARLWGSSSPLWGKLPLRRRGFNYEPHWTQWFQVLFMYLAGWL